MMSKGWGGEFTPIVKKKVRGKVKMTRLEYLVPETLDEALEMLDRGIPLAGGTSLTPERRDLKAVLDLRKLGLDGVQSNEETIGIGAAEKLQTIVDAQAPIPAKLREVCKIEAGWNLRNMITLGGAIMSRDGRSGLLTSLLALNAQITQVPDTRVLPLHEVLLGRNHVKLITGVHFNIPTHFTYEQVARTPADWPLVCAAVGIVQKQAQEKINIALGGFGEYPIRLMEAEKLWTETQDPERVGMVAQDAYKNAEDKWASGEYRSEIAGVLVKRILKEVRS
jgi:probable selenate reductase FAD-binding subunit